MELEYAEPEYADWTKEGYVSWIYRYLIRCNYSDEDWVHPGCAWVRRSCAWTCRRRSGLTEGFARAAG